VRDHRPNLPSDRAVAANPTSHIAPHVEYDASMSSPHDPDAVPLPPSVRWATNSPLPRLDVDGPQATAQVYLHGAHLAAWRPAHAAADVLWMSGHSLFRPDTPIRGGVPICFPWFGPHPSDPTAPAHGFGRLTTWTLCEASESADGTVVLTLQLESDNTSPIWPDYFSADLRLSIGPTLQLALEVHNTGHHAFTFEEALHTYFAVSHIEQVTVSGLENSVYLDKVQGGAQQRQGDGPITFSGETDRVFLDTRSTCVIHDPGLARRITVAKDGSASTVVWNPWVRKAQAMADFGDDEWPGMLCVETANVGKAAVTVRPEDKHTMTARISVEATS
jgi:glucose-6-phosphate 1-epimerase